MSIKTMLMPWVTQRIFSRDTLLNKRVQAERKRMAAGLPHVVHYFHQVDDPYSALVAQILPQLVARYQVQFEFHLVGQPPEAAAPERDKLIAFSRKDAQALAQRWGLCFQDFGQQPSSQAVAHTGVQLLDAIESQRFAELARPLSKTLWSAQSLEQSTSVDQTQLQRLNQHLQKSNALRAKLGHYLGGMFYYEGEWYWAIDRLRHLEERLMQLKLQATSHYSVLFPLDDDLRQPQPLHNPPPIEFYFSFRSPYSAIVAPRVFELARLTGAKVELKYVLPMVMRGLPVPKDKRQYIAHDTAREAHARGIPFGKLNDPVGKPTERGLSLIPLAQAQGVAEAYILSFMKGVWAEGIDAGSDRGLKRIAERAGLNWSQAQAALKDTAWRTMAEGHRAEMFALGLWGVPSFKVGEVSTWGQDRLWLVRQALEAASTPAGQSGQFASPMPSAA